MLRLSRHTASRLQALLVTFLWSTSWVLIKIGLEHMPAISFAGLRYLLAFLMLLPFLLVRPALRAEVHRLRLSDWLWLTLLGVSLYSLTQGAQFLALTELPAMTLCLILCFSPAVVAIAGTVWLGERLSSRQCCGVVLSLAGSAVYLMPLAVPLESLGLLAALVALLANSGGSIIGRSVNRRGHLHPMVVTVTSMGIGSLILVSTGVLVEDLPQLSLSDWAIILWLAGINTAFAFTLWNHTLRRLSAIESTLINSSMLIQIALLAWLFLGEPIGLREAAGLIVTALGVLLVQLE